MVSDDIVEGLPLVEVELKKASCREKARTVYVFSLLNFLSYISHSTVII